MLVIKAELNPIDKITYSDPTDGTMLFTVELLGKLPQINKEKKIELLTAFAEAFKNVIAGGCDCPKCKGKATKIEVKEGR